MTDLSKGGEVCMYVLYGVMYNTGSELSGMNQALGQVPSHNESGGGI